MGDIGRHLLTRRGVTEEAPELVGEERGSTVRLPQVVETCEEDDVLGVGGEGALDGRQSSGLVCDGGDGHAVGGSLPWPPSLSNEDALVLVGQHIDKGAHLGSQELARAGCCDTAVKEGVAVDSAVVGRVAERRVSATSHEGVNGNHAACETRSPKLRASRTYSRDHSRGRSNAGVDNLIANADSVERAPVAIGSGDNGRNLRVESVEVEDAGKELQAVGLGSRENCSDLVAVGTVDPHHRVLLDIRDAIKVSGDLLGRFAVSIGQVRRVGESISLGLGNSGRIGSRRGGCWSGTGIDAGG